MSKGKKITLWIVSGLLAATYLFAGLSKLLMLSEAQQNFAKMGYAPWFAAFIGCCETLGGLGVLIPRLAGLAASGLSIIMVGAIYTTLQQHDYLIALIPLALLVMLVWVAYTRFTEGRSQS